METNIILSARGLSKKFSQEQPLFQRGKDFFLGKKKPCIEALSNVDLDVHAGETLGILGESGSGKSTLARVLMGFFPPDAGVGNFLGNNLFASDSKTRLANLRRMQMVFQDPFSSLDPRMSIRKILREPLSIHKIPEPPTHESLLLQALNEVGLGADVLDRYPAEFSGGQRQRIGICRALILNPALLIADEAVSALDMSVQAQILELLVHLKSARNLSMLFIAHDVAVVRQLSDRILILFKGRVVESLPTECLLTDAFHPYTQSLLKAALELREGFVNKNSLKISTFSPSGGEEIGCSYSSQCVSNSSKCKILPPIYPLHKNHMVACWRGVGNA